MTADKIISVRFAAADLKKIDAEARRQGITRTEYIRQAIRQFIGAEAKE